MGLSTGTDTRDLVYAVCEGVCFAVRHVLETMAGTGNTCTELRVTGGPAESVLLNQLKADITGVPVLIPGPRRGVSAAEQMPGQFPAELLGLAALGATGLGYYATVRDGVKAMIQSEAVYTPDVDRSGYFAERFGLYKETYAGLKGVLGKFAKIE
jgi:sugar (pentulose or hexulose) kinase